MGILIFIPIFLYLAENCLWISDFIAINLITHCFLQQIEMTIGQIGGMPLSTEFSVDWGVFFIFGFHLTTNCHFPLFFGLFFIKITKHPKLERVIIIIFFIPALYIIVGFILMIMLFDPSTGAHPGGIAYTP